MYNICVLSPLKYFINNMQINYVPYYEIYGEKLNLDNL